MDVQSKTELAENLKSKIADRQLSQSKAAQLIGVSSANLSHIVNDRWQQKVISDNIWKKVKWWVDGQSNGNDWNLVETPNYRRISNMCKDAQENAIMLAISAKHGTGKTAALKAYQDQHPKQAFYIECKEHWSRKRFLNEVRKALGMDTDAKSIDEMFDDIVMHLEKRKNPVLILDEADELKEGAFRFIKALYNELEGKSGFIICGGNHLRQRIEKGVRLCRQSYQEIYSRCGDEFHAMHNLDGETIKAICRENGITEKQEMTEVINDANNDLRRVRRRIHKIKLRKSNGHG